MDYQLRIDQFIHIFITEYCTGDYSLEVFTLYSFDTIKKRSSLHILTLMRILGIKFYCLDDIGELSRYYFFDSSMNKVIDHIYIDEDEYCDT